MSNYFIVCYGKIVFDIKKNIVGSKQHISYYLKKKNYKNFQYLFISYSCDTFGFLLNENCTLSITKYSNVLLTYTKISNKTIIIENLKYY